jgi:hypothetical protein
MLDAFRFRAATLVALWAAAFAGAGCAKLVAPVTPVISVSSALTTGATGMASVVARGGMTCRWTISGGAITSAGGAAGVTSGGTNSITWDAPATADAAAIVQLTAPR